MLQTLIRCNLVKIIPYLYQIQITEVIEMKKWFMYTALALILVLGSYQLVMARPGQGAGKGGNPPNENRQPISFVQELKLTDDQVSKIEAFIQKTNQESAVLEDNMQTSRNNLQVLQWSKDFSTEKADAIIKVMQDSMAKRQLLEQKLMVDIKSLLTTEQLALFNKLHAGKGEGPGEGQEPGQGGRAPMIGTMNSINLTAKTFTLTTKDPTGTDVTFQVTYTDATKFMNNKEVAKAEDFKNGTEITVMGKTDLEAKTISARIIQLGKMEPPQGPGEGRGPGKGRGQN
jgi:Spy/CpxP family protein refolding chaperone